MRHRLLANCQALVLDCRSRDFAQVSGLDLDGKTYKLVLQGGLGSSEHHLALNLGGFRGPDDEDELVTRTVRGVVLKIDNTVSGIVLGKLGHKFFVRSFTRTNFLDFDKLASRVHVEDDVASILGELQVIEDLDAVVINLDTSNHGVMWVLLLLLLKENEVIELSSDVLISWLVNCV